MKHFFFLCVLLFAQRTDAQNTIIQRHDNGMFDTIRHISQQGDIVLTETFYKNGRIRSRQWQQDSFQLFDNQGYISTIKKHYLPLPAWLTAYFQYRSSDEVTNWHYRLSSEFFADGKSLRHQQQWVNDSCWIERQFSPAGTCIAYRSLRFEQQIVLDSLWDAKKIQSKQRFLNQKKFIEKDYFSNNQLATVKQRLNDRLTFYSEYDSLGKSIVEWKLDNSIVHPFKDNGLCMYGFLNEKNDTVIPAIYKGVSELSTPYPKGIDRFFE
jgi:hypothetical protein